jgi:splicing factor 3B subunit 3
LDVGQENAQFACLEVDYGETDDKNSLVVKGGIRKSLVIYEMDLGMNTVIRQKELEVPETAHLLIPVPNLPDGPGGLMVVCENYLLYRNNKIQKAVAIPRRLGRPTDR